MGIKNYMKNEDFQMLNTEQIDFLESYITLESQYKNIFNNMNKYHMPSIKAFLKIFMSLI